MKYLLEVGQRCPRETNHSYGRLALGVLYLIQFQQDALCDEIEPLLQRFKKIFEPHHFFGRITDTETDEVVFTNKSETDY